MQVGTYEAQQRAKALELRKKFYSPKPAAKKPTKVVFADPPEWRKSDCSFSEHVLAYNEQKRFEESIKSFSVTHKINLSNIEDIGNRRSLPDICNEVLIDYPGVSLAEVRGVRRTKKVVAARHACIKAVADEREDLSSPLIGKFFRRDHTSILYASGKITARKSRAQENYEATL